MKFVAFEREGEPGFGIVHGERVADLSERWPGIATLGALIRHGNIDEARSLDAAARADIPLAELRLLPPVDAPGAIWCVGVNYPNRNAEYRDASTTPQYPSLFLRTPESLVGHGSPLVRPLESEQLDYEGEIAIVIGTRGRRIPAEHAREHVAGLTLVNEGTVRDWVRHGKFNVTQGKNFAASGAIGPCLVTPDELPPFDALELSTHVNGERRQHDTTAGLTFPFEALIAYISTFATLQPGDIISTGTPTGAGARFDPPRYLAPGDVVEVASSGIGTLRNAVVDEERPAAG